MTSRCFKCFLCNEKGRLVPLCIECICKAHRSCARKWVYRVGRFQRNRLIGFSCPKCTHLNLYCMDGAIHTRLSTLENRKLSLINRIDTVIKNDTMDFDDYRYFKSNKSLLSITDMRDFKYCLWEYIFDNMNTITRPEYCYFYDRLVE